MLNLSLPSLVNAENAGLFISPGRGIHPDRIISTYELIFVRKGRLFMEENGQPLELHAGQTLILWPDRRHRGTATYERDLSFFWIHFRVRTQRGGEKITLPQLATSNRPDYMAELFHRFLSEQEREDFLRQEGDLLLSLMLLEVSRAKDLPSISSATVITDRVTNYIAENFHQGIGAGEIARALRLNPDYLGRIYHRACGHTLTEAIHHRQVREALSLLRETTLNVDEIARACGFFDTRYFRRIFARYQGVSPLRYRRFYTRIHINTR